MICLHVEDARTPSSTSPGSPRGRAACSPRGRRAPRSRDFPDRGSSAQGSRWFASPSSALSNRGVETIEQDQALGQRLVIVLDGGEKAAQHDVEAARFVALELAVAEIGLVNDLRDGEEAAIPHSRAMQKSPERAVTA